MSGIGCIIIILQLGPFVGQVAVGGPLKSLLALPELFSQFDADAIILGVLSLLIVWFIPKRVSRYIPGPLLALVAGDIDGRIIV